MVRDILVEWDVDLPRMWEVALWSVEQKHPEYERAKATFWKMPSIQQWHFGEPDEVTCEIEGYDPKTYAKLPRLRVTVKNAELKTDEKGWTEEGYLITVEDQTWVDGKQTEKKQVFVVVGDSVKDFQFRELSQVTYPN